MHTSNHHQVQSSSCGIHAQAISFLRVMIDTRATTLEHFDLFVCLSPLKKLTHSVLSHCLCGVRYNGFARRCAED